MKTSITLSLMSLLFSASMGMAQIIGTLYDTNFNGNNGEMPKDWTILTVDDGVAINNNRFRLRRDNVGSSAAVRLVTYTGTGNEGVDWDASGWDNYIISTTFQINHENNRVGVIARWDGSFPSGNSSVIGGYWGLIKDGELLIQAGFQQSAGQNQSEILASVALDQAIQTGKTYEMVMALVGSEITLSLYDNAGILINEITAVDSTYKKGNPGVGAYMSYYSRHTEYLSYEVTHVIPEVGAFTLIGGLLLLGGLTIRRSRKTRGV